VSFSHEPENDIGEHGTNADYVAAFRHIYDRMQADGATNVKWVWNIMGLADPVWRAEYRSLYPGDAYVDWIAWDPYNWASCRSVKWQTFAQVVEPFYRWLIANGFGDKPFMLAEFGTVESPADTQAKASWFAAIPAALTAMPDLRALVYFDVPDPPANCNWQIDTSPRSLRAFDHLATSAPFASSARENPDAP
jgi:beta-mannanase